MTMGNSAPEERQIFSAILTPHRSLSGTGFIVLMAVVSAASFAAGTLFLLMGAWPVMGFFGLDVLLIYWAFRANYRGAAAYEQVWVTPSTLILRQVSAAGRVREWKLNPLWVKLDRQVHAEFGLEKLFLVSRGERVPLGSFLPPKEKESFAAALARALNEARIGFPPPLPG